MERQEEGRMSTEDIAGGGEPQPREGEQGHPPEQATQQGAPAGEHGQQQGGGFQPQSPAPGAQGGHEQQGAQPGGYEQQQQGAAPPQGGGHDPQAGGQDPHAAGVQGGQDPQGGAVAQGGHQQQGVGSQDPHAGGGGVATQQPGAEHGATGGGGAQGAPNGHAGGAGNSALLADNDAREFERRWQDVQVGFVDEPQRCVQEADGLVAEVMQRLADGFSRERKDLEAQWASGGEASTEDLRVALQRYRSFFNRLLETS